MGLEVGTVLSALGVGLAGDPLDLEATWSIGGPYAPSKLGALAGFDPSGISYTHNTYESDGSPTRVSIP
jgi:hypothetical protein